MIDLNLIDNNWTLFLDRDGVINHEKDGDYIRHAGEFQFYDGVPEAMAVFARRFGRIFIVTNQKGIGRGLMTEADLAGIHRYMMEGITAEGGRVDKIYFCPDVDAGSPFRKPNPGMGFKAKSEFPDIDLRRSIMVGNTMSDMGFGRNLGVRTIFIPSTKPMPELPHPQIDDCFQGLPAFANALLK